MARRRLMCGHYAGECVSGCAQRRSHSLSLAAAPAAVMTDLVLRANGHTNESAAIAAWLNQHGTCLLAQAAIDDHRFSNQALHYN